MNKKDFIIGIIAITVILFVLDQILFPPDYLCSSYPQPFYTDIPKILALALIMFIWIGLAMSLLNNKKKVKVNA